MTLMVPSGVLARAQALSSEAGVMSAVLLGCTAVPGQGPAAHTGVEVGAAGWWLHQGGIPHPPGAFLTYLGGLPCGLPGPPSLGDLALLPLALPALSTWMPFAGSPWSSSSTRRPWSPDSPNSTCATRPSW